MRRLGVGDALGVSRFTAPRVAARLSVLLGSPQVAADCRAAAERLKPRDGLARSASAVIRMCGGK
jgi:UDP:flavonoid glycosyltransferase YjiC (YdhE family)